ncbi:T9SS type A sorting domain-containing protein [Segetibacter koreensis]|uniref:T9SS type A sorting domain-containing protein n=1 Tax=Segetibacter koreensis TaxID=398037 RepID=UPI000361B980|nr:T9SS type A sorting domain-containing protein [Segetibacter koreensis]
MNFFTIKGSLNKKNLLNTFKPSLLLILFLQLYFFAGAQTPVRAKLAIQLLLSTEPGPQNTADGVVAFFADNFSTSIGNEDSYKFTNLDENLAINCNGTFLSIEGRPTIHGSDTIKLAMWKFRQKSYYLKLNGANFSSSLKAVVKDNYLRKETVVDLASSTLVPFSITTDSASFAADRFSVIFKSGHRTFSLSAAMKFSSAFEESVSLTVAPNPATGNVITLLINNLKKGRYGVSLYSSEGQLVYSGSIDYDGTSGTQTVVIDKRLHAGSYSLLLTCGDQTINKTVLFQ